MKRELGYLMPFLECACSHSPTQLARSAFRDGRECRHWFSGDATAREKSMMYRTSLRQKMQGVCITVAVTSEATFSGNDRKHSVHVSTIYGMPLESLPFRGTHGSGLAGMSDAREAEV
jgi:hypothetical protein